MKIKPRDRLRNSKTSLKNINSNALLQTDLVDNQNASSGNKQTMQVFIIKRILFLIFLLSEEK